LFREAKPLLFRRLAAALGVNFRRCRSHNRTISKLFILWFAVPARM
jgi:hypothetical protein